MPEPRVQDGQISGVVLRVDRFGNLITNIDRRSVQQLAGGRRIIVEAAGRPVPDVVETYAEAAPGSICALFGSSGHLEIAINGGSAAASLGLSRGAPLSVRLKADSTG